MIEDRAGRPRGSFTLASVPSAVMPEYVQGAALRLLLIPLATNVTGPVLQPYRGSLQTAKISPKTLRRHTFSRAASACLQLSKYRD